MSWICGSCDLMVAFVCWELEGNYQLTIKLTPFWLSTDGCQYYTTILCVVQEYSFFKNMYAYCSGKMPSFHHNTILCTTVVHCHMFVSLWCKMRQQPAANRNQALRREDNADLFRNWLYINYHECKRRPHCPIYFSFQLPNLESIRTSLRLTLS